MEAIFEYMKITTLEAVFTCKGAGRLPEYLGSTIRGILGHCFRDFVCETGTRKCFTCGRRSDCLYVRNFSNTGGQGGAINPFVILPCTQGKTEWKTGDECKFQLTLFGTAAEHPGIYMDALGEMEKRGWGAARIPFALNRVTDWEQGTLVCADGKMWMRNLCAHPMKIKAVKARSVLVSFRTPVRIVAGGELFSRLPFQELMRFLMGRFSQMTQAYTNYVMEWEKEEMLRQATQIVTAAQHWDKLDFTRYSMNSSNGKLELPAQTGWVLYEGNLEPFVPYLEAGRYLHIGKNTTIGFGSYELYYDGGITS